MITMPVVQISGGQFVHPDGVPFRYVGVSAFGLFKRWLMNDGPQALVRPILDEWRAIARVGGYTGPIVLRVFRYAAEPNKFAIDPWGYDFRELTKFCDFCGLQGFYVDLTSGDSQIVCPDPNGPRGQQQHLNETCFAIHQCSNVFIETCNEPFKNGIDVASVVPPKWGSYLRDTGAYGEAHQWPWAHLDYVSYHGDRTDDRPLLECPKWVIDLDDQIATLKQLTGLPVVLKEPMGADEINIPGRRSNNPDFFHHLGSCGKLAGVCFHSTAGLASDGLGPITRKCAEAYFAGAR